MTSTPQPPVNAPSQLPAPQPPVGGQGSPSPVNVMGLISFILNAVTALSSISTYVLLLLIDTPNAYSIMNVALTAGLIILCLGAITFGLIGVLQKNRPRLRWMAIGGLVSGATALAGVLLNMLGGFLYTFFV